MGVPAELKSLFEEMQTTWSELKRKLEDQDKEIKAFGEARQETKEAIERLNQRLDEIEVKMKRPMLGGPAEDDSPYKERKEILFKWLRKGEITPEERKALISADDPSAGYLLTPDVTNEIIREVVEYSPIRTVARVRPTSKKSVVVRVKKGRVAAQWTTGHVEREKTGDSSWGLEEIPNHELYALHDVALDELEDNDFDLEAELRTEYGEQFGVAEGAAFIYGDGNGKPEGILTNPNIPTVVSGDASKLTYDALIRLYHELPDPYASNGVWALHRLTLGAIRTIKDNDGRPIWEPGLSAQLPPTILGRPYITCPDMPTVAPNAFPVVFGDFRRGYYIVDRVQISVQRDPFTVPGFVRFYARKRVGGQVVLPAAFRKLKIAAS